MTEKDKVIQRVLIKKVERLNRLEKEYLTSINSQREVFTTLGTENETINSQYFPSNLSSHIYSCIGGVIIIRHSSFKQSNTVTIQAISKRIEIFAKEYPIPYKNGYVSFGNSFRIKRGTIKMGSLSFSNVPDCKLDNLSIAIIEYSDDKTLNDWEEAIEDLKLSFLALNLNIVRQEQSTLKNEFKTIYLTLEEKRNEFAKLLDESKKEEDIQDYLKENPFLIQPHSVCIPKQKLAEKFVTDFVIVNKLEQGLKYTLVEIEKPNMPIFTKNGEFRTEFHHAYNQTLDWDNFIKENGQYIQNTLTGFREPNYLIVAGRSKDFNEEHRNKLSAWNNRQKNTMFLTYDDLLIRLNEIIVNLKELEKNSA